MINWSIICVLQNKIIFFKCVKQTSGRRKYTHHIPNVVYNFCNGKRQSKYRLP